MEETTACYASELFSRIGEEKRDRILGAAIEEFAARGFAGASVNRIAAAADISVGALYKYFATKDDLFLYIIELASQRMADYVDGILEEDIRLLSKIEKLLRLSQMYSQEDPSLIKMYSMFMSESDSTRAQLLVKKIEGVTAEAYRALIARAQAEGEIRGDIDPGILAFMLDNQLISMQFSFACDYYQKRYALFVGEKNARDNEYVVNSMMRALESMLGIPQS